jgi:glycosidase
VRCILRGDFTDMRLPAYQERGNRFEKNLPIIGLSRDPEPTPMQWKAGPNAGKTTSTRWFPLADNFDPA